MTEASRAARFEIIRRWLIAVAAVSLLGCQRGRGTGNEGREEAAKENWGATGNGFIEVKTGVSSTKFNVGAAYAIPRPWKDANLYTFWIFNDAMRAPRCELRPHAPFGGNGWGVSIEMASQGRPVGTTDNYMSYPFASVRSYFVAPSETNGAAVYDGLEVGEPKRSELLVFYFDGTTITARIDAKRDDGSFVKGAFKAAVCQPK